MTKIVIENFSGVAPQIDAKRLSPSMGQEAEDCYLEHGNLSAFPGLESTIYSAGAAGWVDMYFYRDQEWIGNNVPIEYAEAPVINDQFARLIYTNRAAHPRFRVSSGATYRLGIPAPTNPITATPTEIPADPSDIDAETISYVITYVDAFGNEGPPSPPSASVTRVRDTTVNLSAMPGPPAGDYNFGAGAVIRLYRSNSGTSSSAYQFVKELGLTAATPSDGVAGDDLGEVLPSASWTAPPDDDTTLWVEPMRGIINLPNGILAGFSKKTLVFNEPYLLHAWPVEYSITFNEVIVSIAGIAAGVLVCTNERAYLVSGVHPQSMAVQPINIVQPCSSERSLVDMGDYAIYSSPDGLVAVFGMEGSLITEGLVTREQWQATYDHDTIRGFLWEGKYVGFSDAGQAFMFDPGAQEKSLVHLSIGYDCASRVSSTDQVYVKANGGTALSKFGRDFTTPYTYTWRSKKYVTPQPVNFASMRIEVEDADYSDCVVRIYADGVLKDTVDCATAGLTSDTPYTRLSGGYRSKVWEIEVEGTSPVTYLGIYESMSEAV
jgi:hypothetical protein